MRMRTSYPNPEDIQEGYYTDAYFNKAGVIAYHSKPDQYVHMQVFCKRKAVLAGVEQVLAILGDCALENYPKPALEVESLVDGDSIKPWETVMTIEGPYWSFAHLETVYLGILARMTRVATNVRRLKELAPDKQLYFFPARFDYPQCQEWDGRAAFIGGVDNVSTDAQAFLSGKNGEGTMPHALIATFGGNTAEATLAYSKMYPNQPCISLVDFNNNCPKTALEVADAMRKEGRILNGVRLDTSENMVDESLWGDMHNFKPTGVCIELVRKTRNMLDVNGHGSVKIYVSGGFSPEKVKAFEDARAPVDGYGVGSSMFDDKIDFTADIVKIERNGKWMPCAKVGRKERPNPRLKPRKLRN